MKKMSRQLQVALSLDDELYGRFQSQDREIRRLYDRYVRNPKRVMSVVQKTKDGAFRRLQIIDAHVEPSGQERGG